MPGNGRSDYLRVGTHVRITEGNVLGGYKIGHRGVIIAVLQNAFTREIFYRCEMDALGEKPTLILLPREVEPVLLFPPLPLAKKIASAYRRIRMNPSSDRFFAAEESPSSLSTERWFVQQMRKHHQEEKRSIILAIFRLLVFISIVLFNAGCLLILPHFRIKAPWWLIGTINVLALLLLLGTLCSEGDKRACT
jgi:hypothetical protein